MAGRRLRFHGRGGAGAKLASRIVSRAMFLDGSWVQDSPLYGAERRGAPVVAFVRSDDRPVRERGYIDEPDAVVVMDASLLDEVEAGVLDGIDETTLVLVDTPSPESALRTHAGLVGRLLARDVSAIAREHLGAQPISAPIAAFAARAAGLGGWESVRAAIASELAAIGLSRGAVETNLIAARAVFDATPEIGLVARAAGVVTAARSAGERFVVPHLPEYLGTPAIDAGATSELRLTRGWRTHRPVIDLASCSRCTLCFVFCPEGAITIDTQGTPAIDDDHCKGCLVCARECPHDAIHAVPTEAPDAPESAR